MALHPPPKNKKRAGWNGFKSSKFRAPFLSDTVERVGHTHTKNPMQGASARLSVCLSLPLCPTRASNVRERQGGNLWLGWLHQASCAANGNHRQARWLNKHARVLGGESAAREKEETDDTAFVLGRLKPWNTVIAHTSKLNALAHHTSGRELCMYGHT